MSVTVLHGDARDAVSMLLADSSIDSVVTDPPYALVSIAKRFGADDAAPAKGGVYARAAAGFMGKRWDTGETAFDPAFWADVLRVLKPGGHVVAFGGTRTYHRLAVAIEDAGFEIRDQIGWLYGTGFPKSHDVSKGIDRAAGAEREAVAEGAPVKRMIPGADQNAKGSWIKNDSRVYVPRETAPATDAARAWQGWGTALKPAWEPIVLARKPLIGTVVENVLAHGTGAINVDGCRVEGQGNRTFLERSAGNRSRENYRTGTARQSTPSDLGRWPANIAHDGSDEVIAAFPNARGQIAAASSSSDTRQTQNVYGEMRRGNDSPTQPRDAGGSAARFFYSAKASKADRHDSKHPTVKPVDLKRWLCRLVTPPGGTVLDPFAGSGTTGAACLLEGFKAILIEREDEYVADIRRRLAAQQEDIFG